MMSEIQTRYTVIIFHCVNTSPQSVPEDWIENNQRSVKKGWGSY